MCLASESSRAIFPLTVNRVRQGEVSVLLQGEDILIKASDLKNAGVRATPSSREIEGESYVSLASLSPRLKYRLNETTLELGLEVDPAWLDLTVIDLLKGQPQNVRVGDDPSAFFNYSVGADSARQVTAAVEAGASLGPSMLFSSAIRTAEGDLVRGISQYTFDDRVHLTRWTVGESLVNTGALGGAALIAGLSFSTRFALNPYFVSRPGVGLSGETTTPSTAEIYVNGQLVRREEIPPGRFELHNLPVPAGRSEGSVVIRDAFGRESSIRDSYYAANSVLAPGLHEFSYSMGVPREQMATTSLRFGEPTLVARHRLGLGEAWTMGARLEASPRLISGGPTSSLKLPYGQVDLGCSFSGAERRLGVAGLMSYSYTGHSISFGGDVQAMNRRYANLSIKPSDNRALVSSGGFLGVPLSRWLGLTLQGGYSALDQGERSAHGSLVASVSVSERVGLFVQGTYRWSSVLPPIVEGWAGLSLSLAPSLNAGSSVSRSASSTHTSVNLQQSLPTGPGIGYRLEANYGSDGYFVPVSLQGQTGFGYAELSGAVRDGLFEGRGRVAGGLILLGGAVHPSRTIQEGFGLLRVPGVKGVRAYVDQREVGTTSSSGDLVIPGLLAYYGNRLSIAVQDVPMDYTVDAQETVVAPRDRGGVLAVFPIRRFQAAQGSLIVEVAGAEVVPANGQLSLSVGDRRVESPIGSGGEFFLEAVPAGSYPALIELDALRCSFDLEVPASTEAIHDLGSLRCRIP